MLNRIAINLLLILISLATGCDKIKRDKVADNVHEVFGVQARKNLAPNFSWRDQEDNIVDFDSLHGKVTVVNFWATWCKPCREEISDLILLNKELADHGVKIIGVSIDRGPNVNDVVRSYVRTQRIPYQIVISTKELEEAFGNIRVVPTTIIVDNDRKIVRTFIGSHDRGVITQAIKALL